MKWNKYDFIIILCIAVVAWGGLEVLHAFLPIRIIGLYGYFQFFTNKKRPNAGYLNKWHTVYSLFVLYTVISLIWAPHIDVKTELLHTIHIVLIYGVFLLLQDSSVKASRPIEDVILGWAIMAAITTPVAIWEMTTGNHLSSGSAYEEMKLSYGLTRAFAAVTFGNLNSYSVVLCFSLPFLLMSFMQKVPLQKFLWFLTVIVIGIILMNASRGCVICILIALILYLLVNTFSTLSIQKSISFVVIIGASVWVAIEYLHIDLFFQLLDRVDVLGLESNREDVYKAGLHISESTFFMGAGTASTIPLLKKYYSSLNVLVTHNFYLEIIIEYGLVLFILVFGRFYLSAINVFKTKNLALKFYSAFVIISSPVLFLIDDYYSGETAVWIYIFSLMIIETISLRINSKRCICKRAGEICPFQL